MSKGVIKDPNPPTVINAKKKYDPATGGKINGPQNIKFGVLKDLDDGKEYLYFDDPGNGRTKGDPVDFDFAVFPDSGYKIAVNLQEATNASS